MIVWIAWAIHVGSTNGGSAAVGVLITWPLLFFLAATLALLVIGTTRMVRRLQPTTESTGAATFAQESESDPNPSDEDDGEEGEGEDEENGRREESADEDSDDDAKDEQPKAGKPAGKAKA